ncbi:MAG: DegT/DnrJ/EryC1/StrS family aminotransferase [Crocinitomicaceae bacterium]|tara:strand:- start:14331 stop:15464 length:1134 start_codon:yes stop_codon:yes gene_type:complete
MKKIEMVDLVSQYEKIKSTVLPLFEEIMSKAQFINGQEVAAFQNELQDYLGVRHVIPCANGTDALQISLMALGLKPGDEVITPSFTYIATTEVIALLGLTPVFVEVDPDTFCIDPDAVKQAITSKTKAIVPVHLYGQSADMEPLMQIAKANNLFIIEDNAQGIGAEYDFSSGLRLKTGAIGDIGCTSFFPSKNLGCFGDGGAICTNNDDLAIKIRMIANHGQSKKYHHDVVGCNSRLDNLQAGVLRIKLRELDGYIASRQKAASFYDEAFKENENIEIPFQSESSSHVFHQYTIKLKGVNRDDLQDFLKEKNIPSMIYYPIPAHKQKMFVHFNLVCELPKTDQLTEQVISLPMHTELEQEQLDFITQEVLNFVNNSK